MRNSGAEMQFSTRPKFEKSKPGVLCEELSTRAPSTFLNPCFYTFQIVCNGFVMQSVCFSGHHQKLNHCS